jgi:hypothetical protein
VEHNGNLMWSWKKIKKMKTFGLYDAPIVYLGIEIVHPSSSYLFCHQFFKKNPPPNHYCPSQHPQYHFQHFFVSISTSPITILIIPHSSHCFLSPSVIIIPIISSLTPCLDPCHLEVLLLSFEWNQYILKLQCSMSSNYNAPSQIRFLLEHAKSRCWTCWCMLDLGCVADQRPILGHPTRA